MLLAWKVTPRRLDELRCACETSEPTYSEVGGTLQAGPPPGYDVIEDVAVVGTGAPRWQLAANELRGWGLHRAAGMLVSSTTAQASVGATVLNAAPFGRVSVVVPCRVVGLVDEPTRSGFAYGSLPGHPLVGEERFTVELGDDDVVRLRIWSFSRPVGLAAALAPLARRGQALVNRRYCAAAGSLGT